MQSPRFERVRDVLPKHDRRLPHGLYPAAMKVNRLRRSMLVVASAVVATALLLSACASLVRSEGSRHHIYSSLDELIGDSQLVVEATVRDWSATEADDIALTSFRMSAMLQYFPEGLGLKPVDGGESSEADPLVTSDVQVLQVGAGLAPTLRAGERYLLFLTRSGLKGELADAYFVTGGVAGMYQSSDEGKTFTRTSNEDPGLPETLARDQLSRWDPTRPT